MAKKEKIPVIENPSPEIPPGEIPATVGAEIAPSAESVTTADLIGPLAASMPEPTNDETPPHAPPTDSPAPSESIPTPQTLPVIKDNRGTVFNSARHAVDDKGNPRINKRGNFISNSVGRPAGTKTAKGEKVESIPDTDQPDAKPLVTDFMNKTGVADEFDHAAEMYLGMGYGLASGIISDEWQPDDINEHNSIKIPLSAYMRSEGKIELTPKQALGISIIAFSLKRSARPKTRDKLLFIWVKTKSFFQSLFSRKTV